MTKSFKAPDFAGIADELIEDMIIYASVTGLNHIRASFDNGGFTDKGFTPWIKRKDGDTSRALMVNTGNMRDSNQIAERSAQQIVFVNHATYASIHQYGGSISIRVSAKARKFFWYMFKVTKNKRWKYMALTKKDRIVVTIPARPFMGESQVLTDDINEWVAAQIVTRFNNANRQ